MRTTCCLPVLLPRPARRVLRRRRQDRPAAEKRGRARAHGHGRARATSTTTLVLTGTLRPRAQVQVVAEVSARLMRVVQRRGQPRRSAGDAPGRARRDRLPPEPRAGQGGAGGGGGQPGATRVAEKERADNLLKTGGITDKDHLSAQVGLQVAEAARGPGAGGGRDRGAAARARGGPGALRRAAWRSATPTPGAMLAAGTPALHASWTTPCSSSGRAVPSARLRQGEGGRAGRRARWTRSAAGP